MAASCIEDILETGSKDIVIQVLDNGTQTSALQIIRSATSEMKAVLINHIALNLSNSKDEYDDIYSKLEMM